MRLPWRVRPIPALVVLAAAGVLGCGGSGGGARARARAGDVWEIDHADDRAGASAALLAYVSGVHLMVIDGDDAFVGMTHLTAQAKPGGGRTLRLSPALEADLAPTADGMELRFLPPAKPSRCTRRRREGARDDLVDTHLLGAASAPGPGHPRPGPPQSDSSADAGTAAAPLDLSHIDVAGFRVGVKVKDLEATLNRLVGPAARRAPGQGVFPAFAGALSANEDGFRCCGSVEHDVYGWPGFRAA